MAFPDSNSVLDKFQSARNLSRKESQGLLPGFSGKSLENSSNMPLHTKRLPN